MPIIKRPLPKRPKKKLVKVHPDILAHRRKCDELYNRLQRDTDDDVRGVMLEIIGFNCSGYVALEIIAGKCECEIKNTQSAARSTEPTIYRVHLAYTDRTQEPKHGWLYPRMAVVKSSTRMLHSLILAYIELCKHIGRFI